MHVFCRYNISTGEYDGWNSSVNFNVSQLNTRVLTANNNGDLNLRNRRISTLDVYSKFGFNTSESRLVRAFFSLS